MTDSEPESRPAELRAAAAHEGHLLGPRTWEALRRFHAAVLDEGAPAPDYGRPEYLLTVNDAGEVPDEQPLDAFQAWRREAPDADLWFRSAVFEGRPVLLPARWLCHLAGLRHRVVHLYLDHPDSPDSTFVQLRGARKLESPTCFDVPVGGHIPDTGRPEPTLADELNEELALSIHRDVSGLRLIGTYAYPRPREMPDLNVEYRFVYRGNLRPDAFARVRFQDGEVAAFCQFSVSELQHLLVHAPERFASGLTGSFRSIYLHDGCAGKVW